MGTAVHRGRDRPASTPSTIFDTERWDPGDAPEMQWSFPVPAGTNLRVRLYLINQYPGTAGVGQRVFDVAVEDQVLNDYDIVADVGDRVGTMKNFNVTSDGTVNIDLSHVVENPLVNGIEIIDRDATPVVPGPINFLGRRQFDGSTAGPASTLGTPGIDWSSTHGAFALEGKLYTGANNGTFSVRSFDGSSVGPAQQINLNGLTDFPLQSVTGMFFANGRIYYTVQGDPQMYYRYFTPESRIVGSYRFSSGVGDWSDVRGMTLADGTSSSLGPTGTSTRWTSRTAHRCRRRSTGELCHRWVRLGIARTVHLRDRRGRRPER